MGMLVEGNWEVAPIAKSDAKGHFVRPDAQFRDWITQSGESGFKAEANRYHLYVSYACPWASRALIFRSIKGLKDIISFSTVEPLMLENGWEFGESGNDTEDPILHTKYLYENYQKAEANYSGKVTVPVLWDKKKNMIVNNESSEIIRMLNSEFNEFTNKKEDYYPQTLREEINQINEFIYHTINNGVYKCGFASSQEAYNESFDALFSALDTIERRLAKNRYLVGVLLTEADWRLFTTLIRFDVVYYTHFKCNLRRIEDYPNLSNYLRELYQFPGIKETVNFYHIKKHYYGSHRMINPSGIIPKGPAIDYDRPFVR